MHAAVAERPCSGRSAHSPSDASASRAVKIPENTGFHSALQRKTVRELPISRLLVFL